MPYADPANQALPFASGSDTSHDAAVTMRVHHGAQSLAVLGLFLSGNAWTQREIAARLGIGRPSVCARVRELEQAGRIVKTAERRESCAVYRAVVR